MAMMSGLDSRASMSSIAAAHSALSVDGGGYVATLNVTHWQLKRVSGPFCTVSK